MNAHKASLINAILLVTLSLWGYFSSETPSITALIPAFIGAILIAINKGVKKENKVIAHIAVVLTLVILVGLIKPLLGAVDRSDNLAILRVLIMIISTIIAMVYFVKSFIQARKNRIN
jgi:asparagine N-glycosylation enzyme membrane subunit Stt3